MRYPRLLHTLAAFAFLGSLAPAPAVVINGFTAATNNRFADDPSFVLDGFDLSGVGRAANGRWVTMVSPKVYMTANHFAPSSGASITFHSTNDPTGPSLTRTVASSQQIPGTDLRIGVLNAPLGPGYAFYDFATETITNNNQGLTPETPVNPESFIVSPYALTIAAFFGNSVSPTAGVIDLAVGFNLLDFWIDDVALTGVVEDGLAAFIDTEPPPDGNQVPFEARLVGGDSGAPVFVSPSPGELRLVGINWFIAQDEDTNATIANGATYVGNSDQVIRSYINANGGIPEPSGLLAAFLALSFLTLQRRWRG